jgi:hypothetical protein
MKRKFAEIPDNIQRSHIVSALRSIKDRGIPSLRKSSTYFVKFEGDFFPPPLAIGRANFYANGIELGGPGNHVKGGRGTKCFEILEKSGFEIVKVKDVQAELDDNKVSSFQFALEKHLEEFIIRNWSSLEFGKEFEILTSNTGELIGQQYQTDTGPIDLLALSKDRKTYLVLELKRDKSNANAVGQILRYMGYVRDEEAELDQAVKGVIIAHSDSTGSRRAISMTPEVSFWQYKLNFEIAKV